MQLVDYFMKPILLLAVIAMGSQYYLTIKYVYRDNSSMLLTRLKCHQKSSIRLHNSMLHSSSRSLSPTRI